MINKVKNLSIKFKIQLIILFSIFVLSFACFFSINLISNSYKGILYETLSGYLSYSGKEIKKQLDMIDTIMDTIFSNETLQDKLSVYKYTGSKSEKNLCQSEIYRVLSHYVFDFENYGLSYISIFQNDNVFTTSIASTNSLPQIITDDLIRKAREAKGASRYVTEYSNEYGLFLIKEIRSIQHLALDDLGVLIININLADVIDTTLALDSQYQHTSYALYDNDILLYYDTELTKSTAQKLIDNSNSGFQIISMNNDDTDIKDLFAVYGNVPDYGWKFIITVSYDSITKMISLTSKLAILIMSLCILIAMITSSRLSHGLTKHLDLLIKKMRKFGSNELKTENFPIDYTKREDEIGLLHNTFDSMVIQINHLIEQNYINELLKKEAQIKAMESQMDPHFLYNTLDSLNWRAKAIHAVDISKATVALGSLLRITLDNKQTTFTIQDEINTLAYYFTIQKMRYSNQLTYTLHIPEELASCEIPKLTLQPLVENSIRYGLESTGEVCNITISAIEEEQDIIIEVKNSGSVFEENLLEDLLAKRVMPHGFGVGINNIHNRLKMTYGEKYGLNLYNKIDIENGAEFAIVQIRLPLIHAGGFRNYKYQKI